MVVIDTNIAIERVKNKEKIRENITEVTLVEYPPITDYEKFYGKVLIIESSISHRTSKAFEEIGKNQTLCRYLNRFDLHKQRRGTNNQR